MSSDLSHILFDLKLDCTWEVKAKDSKLKASIKYAVLLIICTLNCVACSHAGRSAWHEMLDGQSSIAAYVVWQERERNFSSALKPARYWFIPSSRDKTWGTKVNLAGISLTSPTLSILSWCCYAAVSVWLGSNNAAQQACRQSFC